MKVLIVDPSETAREYIARSLPDSWQKDIRFASGFLEASWHAVATHPDAVIADLLLPDPSGITLLRNLRALNPNAFIIASAGNLLFAQCCHRAGADFFFRSGDDLHILCDQLLAQEHLDHCGQPIPLPEYGYAPLGVHAAFLQEQAA